MAISIALSLLTAVFSFVSAKSNNLQGTRADRPFFVLSGLFAAGTALAVASRLRGLTNVILVSAGPDLLGWLLAASLTIALSGAALVVSSSKPKYSVTESTSPPVIVMC
ncbi:hypothetical protein [Pseudarthrobacter sp. PS3-L1]|uniref:hypothetical protein n=1 Tax=Pseudarthrobacter sp. PS3-L1 TaxID=3046207 RepID=UPI0024B9D747|nr:hypothetical protein [Pseudarthrobacter sp. PS3-L1]MDJ0322022.1 hypothetical protein [Pseudarthrobacter sp. PS3-L1]